MAVFGKKSKERLATCDERIQKVLNEAIKLYDFTIICGARTPDEQFELFKQGREFKDGKWIKVGATVTNIDGKSKKSMHNYSPSLAVDIAPYPIDWSNLQRFKDLSKVVLKCAKDLGIELTWGADWDMDGDIEEHKFKDFPHYEIKG